jgi:cytochrome c peroxidase
MIGKKVLTYMVIGAAVLLLAVSVGTVAAKDPTLTPQEQLGKALFFDKNLSEPRGQACAACHAPNVGYTGPDAKINAQGAVYQGAMPGRFGNRKPPTAAYAGDSPVFSGPPFVGGMFWDGRATGATLHDPLAEQAQGPFLNPLEQNNPDAQAVVRKAKASSYRHLFLEVCGSGKTVDQYYECIGRSIAAYERSKEVSTFTSKFDYWLKGKAKLTGQERQGLELFRGKAKCDGCHVSTGPQPLFTDFTYDNLGVPKNPKNPFYKELDVNPLGADWVDLGLGDALMKAGYPAAVYEPELGKMKVPTLRNVDQRPNNHFVKAYAHNGYFKSLEEIVHFYNTRDVLPVCDAKSIKLAGSKCWPAPEYADTVNHTELGDLGLTRGEENALVAFLKTLSDGYKP